MGTLAEQLKNSAADMDGMASWLDSLDHDTRVQEVRALGPAAQKTLWTLTESSRMTVSDMVPETVPRHAPYSTLRAKHFACLQDLRETILPSSRGRST